MEEGERGGDDDEFFDASDKVQNLSKTTKDAHKGRGNPVMSHVVEHERSRPQPTQTSNAPTNIDWNVDLNRGKPVVSQVVEPEKSGPQPTQTSNASTHGKAAESQAVKHETSSQPAQSKIVSKHRGKPVVSHVVEPEKSWPQPTQTSNASTHGKAAESQAVKHETSSQPAQSKIVSKHRGKPVVSQVVEPEKSGPQPIQTSNASTHGKAAESQVVKHETSSQPAQTNIISKQGKAELCVAVHFHLLMSEQMKFNHNEQKVYLVFGEERLGGWNSMTRELTCSYSKKYDLFELNYFEELPATLITDDNYVKYKYVLKEKHGSEIIWEHYIKNDLYGQDVNRFVTVPKSYGKLDTWQQYDGFFEKTPDIFTGRILNWWQDIVLKHAEQSFRAFFPEYKMEQSALDFLRNLHMVFSGLERVYVIDVKFWKKSEYFGKFINKLSMGILRDRCEKEDDKEYTTILVLSVLLFLYETKSYDFTDPDKTTLSQLLKVSPDSGNQTCLELEVVKRYLPDKRPNILLAVKKHVQDTLKNTNDPSWLCVMPWIHYLSGNCKPFEDIPFDMRHDEKEPKWWGIAHVKQEIEKFKKKSWNILPTAMVKNLRQLFKMDYLLPRTFLTVTDLNHLEELISTELFPVEVCLANLIFHLKAGKGQKKKEQIVQKCLDCLLKHHDAHFSETHCLEVQAKMSYKISSQMITECTCYMYPACEDETVWRCVQMFLRYVGLFERSSTEMENQKYENEVHNAYTKVKEWMSLKDKAKNTGKEQEIFIKVWDKLYAQEMVHSEKVRNNWNARLSNDLLKTFQNRLIMNNSLMGWFVKFYCKTFDDFNPYMQEQLSKIAFEAVEVGHRQDYSEFNEKENERFGLLLSKLFLSEWEKFESGSNNEQRVMVQFLLNWSAFSQYLAIYYNDEGRAKMLSDECILKLTSATSMVEHLLDTLIDGSVTVDYLNLINEKQSRLLELSRLLPKNIPSDLIEKSACVRTKELDAFRDLAKLVATLSTLCQSLNKVDKTEIDSVMRRQADINGYRVNGLCKVETVTEETSVDTLDPKPVGFDASMLVVETLTDLQRCYSSSTFCAMWHEKCREVGDGCQTLDDVISFIWNPVKESFELLATNITLGDVTFNQFERLFGRKYKDDLEAMRRELESFGLESVLTTKRLRQLTKYRQLETCLSGAKSILEFASQYSLTGDFQQIRTIAEYEESDMQMKALDEKLIDTCKSLKDLTKEQAECLKTFVDCKELITWLKKSMEHSGLKELKVFVDLALMSAGEEPMNIARVQCLHTAVTGYAPLIFDLTDETGFEDLLYLCGNVWKELEVNPSLPDKLKDTARHLQWLEKIQMAHGSMEVTSMMQVEACNECGEYTLGSNTWPKKKSTKVTMSLLQLEDILKLTVPGDEGKRETRNYNIEQLQDLQSRLMLVAGNSEKGTESVEKFTMIFDGALRLSNVYLKLCSAGCVLFKNWSACFFCDPGRPVCVILEFGETESQLKGRQSATEELRDIIPKLAGFMESCFDGWMQFIKDKRKKYHHLNYFTTDQLVILQRELVKIGTSEDPSHLIFPLLSAVKKDCTREDLHMAMVDAKTDLDGEVAKAEEEESVQEELVQDVNEDAEIKFIYELIEQGFSESLARKAYKHTGADVSEGFVWCMENNDEEEEEETVQENLDPHTEPIAVSAFTRWNQSSDSFQDVISSRIKSMKKQGGTGSAPLIKDLMLIWDAFLESISSNIQDYLSLEHLGLILKHLAKRDEEVIERKFPPNFEEGAPNLIVCRSGEILTTTLSIYSMDASQPLPRSEEILMCTEYTRADEIDIFWRRAIFDGGRKIHCLVNADSLRFDVSETAEKLLEDYLLESNSRGLPYRLIVICGSDNEYRSSLVSRLDKHKRNALPLKMDAIRSYLKGHLIVKANDINGVRPAALVDKERSTARVIKSWRSGVGKTLFKRRREEEVKQLNPGQVIATCVSIPLQDKTVNTHYVVQRLLEQTSKPGDMFARLFHIDVAHEVQQGVDNLLFNLLILGYLSDNAGFVWRKSVTDLYLVETLPLMICYSAKKNDLSYLHQILDILPDMTCRSPEESVEWLENERSPGLDQLFDEKECMSDVFQRPFQCLIQLERKSNTQMVFNPEKGQKGNKQEVLQTVLRHCGLKKPSWSELYHFVNFLNTQLTSFETNIFVNGAGAGDFPGFGQFVLTFLIHMSRDFATHSLDLSEKTPGLTDRKDVDETDENDDLKQFQMRRTWESSPHPYLFFNEDKTTFTFLGFHIDKGNRNVTDHQTGDILERNIMSVQLYNILEVNGVPLQENFDELSRGDKIQRLRNVMGINETHDPDDTYELTTDNVKKMMAIHMRFRCDIPVIVMGETGCGKTRLVKFMCALQIPPGSTTQNMIIMKVHGGTTNKDIIRKVKRAEKIAYDNMKVKNDMFTVLFFDEANTTESVGLIKEIMCDKSLEGKKLDLCKNLKIVAACNPYRLHSDALIKKLEQAGLGYHVDADETNDRLGRVPMRRLVYRVQPLPQSLLPLVWDFGQLSTHVEKLYIKQMVRRYIENGKIPNLKKLKEVVSDILTDCQDYMRQQEDECSFVSLRDVDRTLTVMSWFYSQENAKLFELMDEKIRNKRGKEYSLDAVTRSLILALGVCYHACLKSRSEYRERIAKYFQNPCQLQNGSTQIADEIDSCQEVYLDNVHLEETIARNMALKENVFMMVVCVELRLPLFLVGKPGSSKSLAKTIVSDAMQGNAAKFELFKLHKHAQMVSFQCSPLSTPEGIVGTFRQCAQFQEDKDLDTFVSVVVLDEIGLAEDSPRMPLKTLHPLLEDGCQGEEEPKEYMKVAFIGISNWALDPAKMNRGILVQREVPDIVELKSSASGICQTTTGLGTLIEPLIEPMAISYLEVFNKASQEMREFFGLRDFYSLVKMVFNFVDKSKQNPSWHEMLHSIKRNFDGLEKVDPEENFKKHLSSVIHIEMEPRETDPDCSTSGLIHACLFDTNKLNRESRYLLLITETYGALSIIQQQILSGGSQNRPITIFGSSFPSDQEYTQVCRNINKIKLCMEAGKTVLLLNLENLYESLYDALNQYYVYFGGDRYVDLGLGTHRVKCPVHKDFRLIVVAEKKTVYKVFPIPLINRLEKHFMNINTMLTDKQQGLVDKLKCWSADFVKTSATDESHKVNVGEHFVGYHEDACSAIINHVCEANKAMLESNEMETDFENKILEEAKATLLWCATPDAVFRLSESDLPYDERQDLSKLYLRKQAHGSFLEYIEQKLVTENSKQLFIQVTTHSKLLGNVHKTEISKACKIEVAQILLVESLSSFDTEQQFTGKLQQHLKSHTKKPILVIIQCDSGHVNANLIACARFCALDVFENMRDELTMPVHMIFIVHLPRIAGGCFTGFQCGVWQSVHIDDLYPEDKNKPQLYEMQDRSVAKLLRDALKSVRKSVDEEETEGVSFERVKGLILDCVQAALALVKDVDENKEREKQRIELVMKLLYTEETSDLTCSFSYGICCIIAKLLSEKEKENQGFIQPCDWMLKEATSSDKISEAGTFRRSCLKILESKVSPVLAGVIALLDTNQNIDICKDATSAWKREMWLKVLNTPDALDVKYSDLQSPTQRSELQEAMVLYTGIGENVFQSKMPFSWMFMSQINDILLTTTKASYEDVMVMYQRIMCLLKEIPLCQLLLEIEEDELIEEGLKDYIGDFVCSVYNNGSQNENKVVSEALYKKTMSLYKLFDENCLLSAVTCVHLAYDDMAIGLSYLRLISSVWAECSNQILTLQARTPKPEVLKADDIVLAAAFLLCQHVSPVKLDESSNRSQLVIDSSAKRIEWLRNLQQYRPVLEKTLCFLGQQAHASAIFDEETMHVKCHWERIIVMKLFVEHICITREEKTYVNYCMPLWSQLTKLGENVNMKMLKPIIKLEDFMKLINKKHVKELLGDANQCSQCERKIDSVPVKLPCGDLVCRGCFNGLRTRDRKCSTCKEFFSEDWEPTRENQNLKEKEIEILKEYQKKCNAFFMDMVSQLCFSENSAPSDEVIEKLLSFVTFDGTKESGVLQTKVMSIFDTGIDPTPVFRSFLLQLLLKTSMKNVKENLDAYLKKADDIIKRQTAELEQDATENDSPDTKQYLELCLMVIQCLEDVFRQESNSAEDELKYASDALSCVANDLDKEELSVNKLVCLAKARMGLTTCAKYLNSALEENYQLLPNVKSLLKAAKSVCKDECKCEWPRIYLVKTITRCHGLDQYYKLCSSKDDMLNWVFLPEAKIDDVHPVSDRYIVCGEDYLRIRQAVTSVALGGDITELDSLLQELGSEKKSTAVFLDLAIHREITCSCIFPLDTRPVQETRVAVFEKFITEKKSSEMSQQALQNRLLPKELRVADYLDISSQSLQCLIVHYMSVMTELEGNMTLMQTLASLITSADSYQVAFLPTMPQDNTDEVRDLLLKDVDGKDKYYKQITLYKCPNGHIYLVTNCGKPMEKTNCPDCGAEIGGSGDHEAFASNKLDDNTDETKSGHILGPPAERPKSAYPERDMTPTHCACVRLLLHMSLYLGSARNTDAICNIISDVLKKEDVSTFLWEHMKVDIQNLETALGKSTDDVFICLHIVIDNLMKRHLKGPGVAAAEDVRLLSSKVSRKEWEIKFVKTYLQDTFNNLEDVLKSSNKKIAGDDRLGGNPLLCLMHETQSVSNAVENPQMLQEVPRVWRFRTPISLEHLYNEFKSAETVGDEQCKVLKLFLKEECHLRALRYVPNIQRLQRALLKKYQRKLDRNEGNAITIKEIIDSKVAGPETHLLIKDFKEAWELVRISLKEYVCRIDIGSVIVPEQLCNTSITDDTPVSILLPTTKGMGLCSFALLDFLMRRVQNGFLDNYLKETKRSYSSFLSVKPKELTTAHLISFDTQQDLLPLILANCQYTFEMGKGTTIQYDFQGLERQVIDRFLLSKSRIDVGPILQIEIMVYRTEVTNTAVFETLEEKIPQVPLSHAVKTQVSGEIRTYPDLCESLVNMDIAISFLKSTGGKPEQNLHEFMTDVLRMNTSVSSRTAQQACQFQHCKKTWLHLSLLKSAMMADNNKTIASIFECVKQTYHEKLQQEMVEMLDPILRGFTIEKLAPLVEVLHEYIVLYVAVDEKADNIIDQKLQDHLPVYIDLLYEEDDTDNVMNTVGELLPDVLNRHCLPLWLMAYNILREKQTGDRRL